MAVENQDGLLPLVADGLQGRDLALFFRDREVLLPRERGQLLQLVLAREVPRLRLPVPFRGGPEDAPHLGGNPFDYAHGEPLAGQGGVDRGDRVRGGDRLEARGIAEGAIPAAAKAGQGMNHRRPVRRRRLEARPGAAAKDPNGRHPRRRREVHRPGVVTEKHRRARQQPRQHGQVRRPLAQPQVRAGQWHEVLPLRLRSHPEGRQAVPPPQVRGHLGKSLRRPGLQAHVRETRRRAHRVLPALESQGSQPRRLRLHRQSRRGRRQFPPQHRGRQPQAAPPIRLLRRGDHPLGKHARRLDAQGHPQPGREILIRRLRAQGHPPRRRHRGRHRRLQPVAPRRRRHHDLRRPLPHHRQQPIPLRRRLLGPGREGIQRGGQPLHRLLALPRRHQQRGQPRIRRPHDHGQPRGRPPRPQRLQGRGQEHEVPEGIQLQDQGTAGGIHGAGWSSIVTRRAVRRR